MINFKDIINNANPDKLGYIITIDGKPVWDYSAGPNYTVSLISEGTWEGIEEEYVTIGELRKYIVASEIPFDVVVFKKEEDRELLKNYKWEDKQLNFYH